MKVKKITFQNHPILKDNEFNFENNGLIQDITLLVGENGCGKTILLDELYKIIGSGINFWKDDVDRKIEILFSSEEKSAINLPSQLIVIDYKKEYGEGFNRIKLFDDKGDQIRDNIPLMIEKINKNLKCLYSTVEINFESRKIEAIKATTTDADNKPKKKSSVDLATEIAQLLVDIKAQDDAESTKWIKENAGNTTKIPVIEGKLDRFKKAYSKMFDGKELCDIRPQNGSHNVMFKDIENSVEFSISNLSSGEKQVVYRIGYLLRDFANMSGGLILIDEPELSLHPRWQIKYIDFLKEIFANTGSMIAQFIIATHSPYLLKNSLNKVGIFTFGKNSGKLTIERPDQNSWSLFSNGPSLGEINYYAFRLPTMEFHNELYGKIKEKENKKFIDKPNYPSESMEKYFEDNGYSRIKSWIDNSTPKNETLMSFIRNKIDHPENTNRPDYTDEELNQSIKNMISLL